MLGLLYKDLLIMKKEIILNMLAAMGYSILFIGAFIANSDTDVQFIKMINIFICIGVFTVVGGMQNNTLRTDETEIYKKFIISSPKTAWGHVGSKYCESLIFGIFILIWGLLCDAILESIAGIEGKGYILFLTFFFIQLLLRAVDMPFLFRFGTSKGMSIKVAMLTGFVFAIIVYGLFGPLPKGGIEEIILSVFNWFMEYEELSDTLKMIKKIFPFFASAMFVSSYFISVKMYRKS